LVFELLRVLYLDEYKPKGAKTYKLMCGEAVKGTILYLLSTVKSYSYGEIGDYLQHIKELGISP